MSDKKQTAMMQAIEEFTEWSLQIEGNETPDQVMNAVIKRLEELLPTEREQIIQANRDGQRFHDSENHLYLFSDEYYETTYSNGE